MRTNGIIFSTLAVLSLMAASALAQTSERNPNPERPPVAVAPPVNAEAPPGFVYEQKAAGGRQPLVQPQQAQAVIDKFKAAYSKLGSPRVLIYVNRELVDENSGLKLIARTEKVDATTQQANPGAIKGAADSANNAETSSRTEKTARENRYRLQEQKELSLADKQTVRDVERLFGRPLRMAGASLADQRVATQFIAEKSPGTARTEVDQARQDREALSRIADVAVEILIASKDVQVAEVSGDKTYSVPDIQATAIQLKDAKILGQASSSEILGGGGGARGFDVREVSEAVALALMEDMLAGTPTAGTN